MPDTDVIKVNSDTLELDSAIPKIVDFYSYYDSGLTPTPSAGIIYHRFGLGSEQIVYQYAPGKRQVCYKQDEGDEDSEVYTVAFPYVIALIAFEKGAFKGVRHFYSPTPITSLDQRLYLVNLPNTNTIGYNNTSVGWVCLYVEEDTGRDLKDLKSKLDYALARLDPMGEPYNYSNMSETDGYMFYQAERSEQQWLSNPEEWQTKSEGDASWVLDESTWIPARIAIDDEMATAHVGHTPEIDAYDYTLRAALFQGHYVYYDKPGAVLMNQWALSSPATRVELFRDNVTEVVQESKTEQISFDQLRVTASFTNHFEGVEAILKKSKTRYCFDCGKAMNSSTVLGDNVIISVTIPDGVGVVDMMSLENLTPHTSPVLSSVRINATYLCPDCIEQSAIPSFIFGRHDSRGDAVDYVASRYNSLDGLWERMYVHKAMCAQIYVDSFKMPYVAMDVKWAHLYQTYRPPLNFGIVHPDFRDNLTEINKCNHCGSSWNADIDPRTWQVRLSNDLYPALLRSYMANGAPKDTDELREAVASRQSSQFCWLCIDYSQPNRISFWNPLLESWMWEHYNNMNTTLELVGKDKDLIETFLSSDKSYKKVTTGYNDDPIWREIYHLIVYGSTFSPSCLTEPPVKSELNPLFCLPCYEADKSRVPEFMKHAESSPKSKKANPKS